MMDNLIKIVCSKSSTAKDKTDAYITIVQFVMKDLKCFENSIVENHGSNLLKNIKMHIDLKSERSGGKEVSLAALKVLGFYLSISPDILEKVHGEVLLSEIIDCLCNLLQSDKGKQFYVTAFWCFANQHIPNQILAKHVHKIVTCFKYHSSKHPSGTIMVEGLKTIKKLCEMCPIEMEKEMDNCLDYIFVELGSTHLFRGAVDVMISCTPILLKNFTSRNYILKQLNQELCSKINKHYQDSASRTHLIKLWTCFSKLMGEEFFQLDHQVRNPTFKVMGVMFNHLSLETQFSLYDLWTTLIDGIVNVPDEIEKREKILLQPLQLYHYYENDDIAEKCLKTYWYLICKIDLKINENVEKFVLPIFEEFLKDNKHALSNKKSMECKTPVKTKKAVGNIETPKTPKVSSSSSSMLKSYVVEMLCVILSEPDKRRDIKGMKLQPFSGPRLSLINLSKYSLRFGQLLLEATRSCLSVNDMAIRSWVLFLTIALELPQSSDEGKQLWSTILSSLKCIIDEEFGNIEFILKVLPLIPITEPYKELICDKNKLGLPTFFIIQSILHPKFVKNDIFENEKFFVLFERMLEILFNRISGQLSTALDVFYCLDNIRSLINDGVSWRLWSTLCHVLINYVNLTNEVNEGTATKYKFDVVLRSLLYPLNCIDWSRLKDGEKNTLKETWSELYETFKRAISLLPGLQNNPIVKDLCDSIVEHCNKVGQKSFDLVTNMLWMVVKSEDLEVVNSSSFDIHEFHPSKVKTKKEHQVGNIQYFLDCLKNLIVKMIDENQGQISRGSEIILFEIVEMMDYFFQKLKRYEDLHHTMSTLSDIIQRLFEKSNAKLMNQLVKLSDSIFSAFENLSDVPYEDDLLLLLEPLMIKSLLFKRKQTNIRVVKFWNKTFGKNSSLKYSDILKDSLINCKTPVKAIMNGSKPYFVQEFDDNAQFPDIDNDIPIICVHSKENTSPKKKFGSFLNKDTKDNDLKPSPIKLSSYIKSPSKLKSPLGKGVSIVSSPLSTRRYSKRKSRSNKGDEEFVEIKDTPKKANLLTEHQKEVRREKKTIPLMYNSLDQSQDTTLFQSYSQDQSNSQTTIGESSRSNPVQIEQSDSNNIDFMKCSSTQSKDSIEKTSVVDDQQIVVELNSTCEDEDDSYIPSSQTQESFSQLRSPYVDGDQQKRIVAESPEEQFLKNVSSFTNLLNKDDFKSQSTDKECLQKDDLVVGKLESILENDKENVLCKNKEFVAHRLDDWLSSDCVDRIDKKVISKLLPDTSSKVISAYTNNFDKVNDDIKLAGTSNGRRKRKVIPNEGVITKKKRSKSLGSAVYSNETHTSNIKIEQDTCNLLKNDGVLKKTSERRRKSRGGRISCQKGDILNFWGDSKRLKTEIKVEDVILPTTNEESTIADKESDSHDEGFQIVDSDDITLAHLKKTEEISNEPNNGENEAKDQSISNEESTIADKESDSHDEGFQIVDLDDITLAHLKKTEEISNEPNNGEHEAKDQNISDPSDLIKGQSVVDNIETKNLDENISCASKATMNINHDSCIVSESKKLNIEHSGAFTSDNNINPANDSKSSDFIETGNDKYLNITKNNVLCIADSIENEDCKPLLETIDHLDRNDLIDLLIIEKESDVNINEFPTDDQIADKDIKVFEYGKKNEIDDSSNLVNSDEICKSQIEVQNMKTYDYETNTTLNNIDVSPVSKGPTMGSPASGILKKKSFINQSPSPPFKNRRVSFQLPEGISQKSDEEKEKFSLLLNKGRKQKTKTIPRCIYPELKDCSVPIEKILPSLTFSRGVGHLVRAQNILTIGDLSSLSEAQVENLPIRSPKIRTVRNVLNTFSTQQARVKGTPKSPLLLDIKASEFISPKKENSSKENDLIMTPSKHNENYRPTTLFSNTPIKDEFKPAPKKGSLPNMNIPASIDKEGSDISKSVEEHFKITNDDGGKVEKDLPNKEPQKMEASSFIEVIKVLDKFNPNTDLSNEITGTFNDDENVLKKKSNLEDLNSSFKVFPNSDMDDNDASLEITNNHISEGNVEDVSSPFKFTPTKLPPDDHKLEQPLKDILSITEISPIKTYRKEEMNSFEDAGKMKVYSLENNDKESVPLKESLNLVSDMKMKNSSVRSNTVTLDLQNDDDFDNSVCVDQMEGVTPINVSNSSFENCNQNNDNNTKEMNSETILSSEGQTNLCNPNITSLLLTERNIESETSIESNNVIKDPKRSPTELLRSIDLTTLSTNDIFELVDELHSFKSKAMQELRTRMFTHDNSKS